LRADPDALAARKERTGKDDVHVGLLRDLLEVETLTGVASRCRARADRERLQAGERDGDSVGNAEREKVDVRFGSQHSEGENHEAGDGSRSWRFPGEVGSSIDRLSSELLGRHVVRRADYGACLREPAFGGFFGLRRCLYRACQAEVEKLHDEERLVVVHSDIVELANVRVANLCRRAHFAPKAFLRALVSL